MFSFREWLLLKISEMYKYVAYSKNIYSYDDMNEM